MSRKNFKISFGSMVFLFQLLFLPVLLAAQEPLLESAKADYFKGDFLQLNDKLQVLQRDYPDHPTTAILRGLTLLNGGRIEDILNGKELIEKNARRSPDDPFSNFALGMLYKEQEIQRSARKYFLKALEYDEQMVQALVELGLDYSQEVRKYYNRYTDTEVALSYRRYALDDYDYAASYLRKALQLDPSNREAAYILGSLYYDLEEYNLMTQLFQQMKVHYPEDRDINLFLGLVNLARHEYQEAYQSFMTALEKMSPVESEQFLNPEYLVKNPGQLASSADVHSFWLAKDPMFLTAENERMLEHFGRFAYANLAFSVPKLEIEGYKTDRGRTYIRYGRPQYVIEYGKSMEFGAIYPPMQIWIYPQFQLAFSDEFWNGFYQYTEPTLNSRSVFKERTAVNYTLHAENVFAEMPDHFNFTLAGGKFNALYQLNFFKEKERTIAYLSFAVPIEDQLYHSVQKISAGVFELDDKKLPANKFLVDFEGQLNQSSVYAAENYFVHNFNFYPPVGNLFYSFEILNNTLHKNFVDRREISIPDFDEDTLQISDVVIASKISTVPQEGQLQRNNLTIYPNFQRIFKTTDTLFVYFEIYNLTASTEGNVHYTVESGLSETGEGGFLGSIFTRKKKISVVNEYSGRNTSDFVIQSVDIKNIEAGKYDFSIVVNDQIKKTTVEQKITGVIINSLNN